jgi:hypothetical protein
VIINFLLNPAVLKGKMTKMKSYKNLSGNSGVTAFGIGKNYIDIKFKDDFIYRYNEIKPGKHSIEIMKKLADKGEGLSTFISQHVKDNYFSKINDN